MERERAEPTVLCTTLATVVPVEAQNRAKKWMTKQMLSFRLVHVSAREQLHACLRFKLVHVSENVQQPRLGSHFSVGLEKSV